MYSNKQYSNNYLHSRAENYSNLLKYRLNGTHTTHVSAWLTFLHMTFPSVRKCPVGGSIAIHNEHMKCIRKSINHLPRNHYDGIYNPSIKLPVITLPPKFCPDIDHKSKTRKTAGTAGNPARQQTTWCDIQINVKYY